LENYVNKLRFLFILIFMIPVSSLQAYGSGLPDFTPLVDKVAPTVVNISVSRNVQQQSQRSLLDNFFRRNRPSQGQQEFTPPQNSEGSGFIISKDGYVLTNRHVVLLADEIIVKMNNGREYTAELVGEDSGTDVALLKIKADSLPVISTGDSEQLKVGEWVLGFGAPFGFEQTVTAGIVSAKKRTLGREMYVPYIQTDVAINPGNSGGPLVDMDGKVVGINSQILSRSGGYIGLSFAIPIELALHVSEQFKKFGKIKRGYLGVQYQDVTYSLAQSFDMDKVEGALLSDVTKGSVAEEAGLKNGDIVLKFDGKKIHRSGELPFIVGLILPGTTVKVDIVRAGKSMQLDLTVGERPDQPEEASQPEIEPESSSLGLVVEDINDEIRQAFDVEGVIVSRLQSGPAARAGIRRGDIILSLANRNIVSVAQFNELVSSLPKGEMVAVLIFSPPGSQRYLTMQIPD